MRMDAGKDKKPSEYCLKLTSCAARTLFPPAPGESRENVLECGSGF